MSQVVAARVGRLDDADRQLAHAARRLVRRWALTLAVAVVLTAVGVLLLGLMVIEFPVGILTLAGLWYPSAGAYLIYQCVPRTPSAAAGIHPEGPDLAWLADWVGQHVTDRPRVRLTPEFGVFIDHGYLYIGMALLEGLNEDELLVLVRDAYAQEQVDSRWGVGFAHELAFGSLGRGLWGRQDARLSRRLFAGLHARTRAFLEARDSQARERRTAQIPPRVVDRVDTVAEAWEHMVEAWLRPALELRLWHAAPYSGLGVFLDACELAGLFDSVDRESGSSLVDQRPSLRTHEQRVAALLVADASHEDEPIDWDLHPTMIDIRSWRTILGRALLASGRLAGRPVPSSFDGLRAIVSNAEQGLVESLLTNSDIIEDPSAAVARSRAEVAHVLRVAARLALVDSGVAYPSWEWPVGTVLRHRDGVPLTIPEPADPEDLRGWLIDLGVDPAEPLWISDSAPPPDEKALLAFNANVRPQGRRVVFTDRAMWAFARRPSILRRISHEIDGPLASADEAMTAIDRGQVVPHTLFKLEWEHVVSARLRPRLGGHWWKLDLVSARGERVQVRALGNARDEEQVLALMLGDRLHARWSWRRPLVRRLRNWFGFLCLGISGFGLAVAAIALVNPVEGTTRVDWLEFGGASVVLLGLGFLPDLVTSMRDRRRLPSWLDGPEPKTLLTTRPPK